MSEGWVEGLPKRFVHGHNQRGIRGSEHPLWKGEDISYCRLHDWLRKNRVCTGVCESCGAAPAPKRGTTTGTELANVSGEYRRDITDYLELCRACHIRYDSGDLQLAATA